MVHLFSERTASFNQFHKTGLLSMGVKIHPRFQAGLVTTAGADTDAVETHPQMPENGPDAQSGPQVDTESRAEVAGQPSEQLEIAVDKSVLRDKSMRDGSGLASPGQAERSGSFADKSLDGSRGLQVSFGNLPPVPQENEDPIGRNESPGPLTRRGPRESLPSVPEEMINSDVAPSEKLSVIAPNLTTADAPKVIITEPSPPDEAPNGAPPGCVNFPPPQEEAQAPELTPSSTVPALMETIPMIEENQITPEPQPQDMMQDVQTFIGDPHSAPKIQNHYSRLPSLFEMCPPDTETKGMVTRVFRGILRACFDQSVHTIQDASQFGSDIEIYCRGVDLLHAQTCFCQGVLPSTDEIRQKFIDLHEL
jgi:hypothetical protein